MTVGEMLSRMSAREFAEWQAYYRIEPFGEEMRELQVGILAATVANSAPMGKKGRKPAKPEDFMPVARANKKAEPVKSPKAFRQQFLADFGHRLAPAKRKGKDGG